MFFLTSASGNLQVQRCYLKKKQVVFNANRKHLIIRRMGSTDSDNAVQSLSHEFHFFLHFLYVCNFSLFGPFLFVVYVYDDSIVDIDDISKRNQNKL